MDPDQSDSYASITSCLVRWREGEDDGLPQLTTLVYAELHRLAAVFFRQERGGHTLQPTALVLELYLNLPAVRAIHWKCRMCYRPAAVRIAAVTPVRTVVAVAQVTGIPWGSTNFAIDFRANCAALGKCRLPLNASK